MKITFINKVQQYPVKLRTGLHVAVLSVHVLGLARTVSRTAMARQVAGHLCSPGSAQWAHPEGWCTLFSSGAFERGGVSLVSTLLGDPILVLPYISLSLTPVH